MTRIPNPKLKDKTSPRKIDLDVQPVIPEKALKAGSIKDKTPVYIPELRMVVYVKGPADAKEISKKYLTRNLKPTR